MIKKIGTAKAVKQPNIYLKHSYSSRPSGKTKTVWIKITPTIKGNLRKLIVCDILLFILVSLSHIAIVTTLKNHLLSVHILILQLY